MQCENQRRSTSLTDATDIENELKIGTNKDELNCIHFIGKGTFGLSTLWIAEHKPSSKFVMVRKTKLELLKYDDLENLQYEMRLSCQLQHPGILSYHCSFVQNREIWTVFPFFDYGSCHDIIQAGFSNGFEESVTAYILRNVLQALEYLHKVGYVHRAVKAAHILVSSAGRIALTGLRYCYPLCSNGCNSRTVHNFPDHAVAVLPWIAPEVLEQNILGYNEKSDIYSLGITALELATGHVPFSELPATEIFLEKLNGQMPEPLNFHIIKRKSISGSTSDIETKDKNNQTVQQTSPVRSYSFQSQLTPPSKPRRNLSVPSADQPSSQTKRLSSQLQQVIEICLERHPNQRPSASHLIGMSLFKQVKKRSREFLSISDMLHPVAPITSVCKSASEGHAEEQKDNLSLETENINIIEDWIL